MIMDPEKRQKTQPKWRGKRKHFKKPRKWVDRGAQHEEEEVVVDPRPETSSPGQDSPHRHGPWANPRARDVNITPKQEETGCDKIHPSRLGLFTVNVKKRKSGMAAAAVMAPPPPGHDQRNYFSHPPHHVQQRPHSNGLNINGVHQQNQSQQRSQNYDRDQRQRQSNGPPLTPTTPGSGPMPSHIQVAKPYVFQQAIEGCLKDIGVAQAREDNMRLAGVQWIDNVRKALKLPVRTFDTAVIYYHKFRLVHSDGEYSFVDAAGAALFAACKIEDTLKKSRDILCAAHNLKVQNRAEHLSPDDSMFEHQSRNIIGLERLMLESSSFDFRNRHPQHRLIKFAKFYNIQRSSSILKTAYTICLDLYRTFAPLKQCTATLAFACLELSARLLNETDDHPGVRDIVNGRDYQRWNITRAEVMETLLDLLELYTHYRAQTLIGPEFALDTFLEVRIPLNQELSDRGLPRFTEYIDPGHISGRADVGSYAATVNGVSAAANKAANGTNHNHKDDHRRQSPTSPISGSGNSATAPTPTIPSSSSSLSSRQQQQQQNGIRQKAGERGREGTVRFMLNPDRERKEREIVAEYGPPHSLVLGVGPGTTTTTATTSPATATATAIGGGSSSNIISQPTSTRSTSPTTATTHSRR